MAGSSNQPPIAVNDSASVTVDGTTTASGNVLTNDSDPQGLPLDVSEVDGQAADVGATVVGEYGSLVLGANGSYQYVLATGQANVQALQPGQTVTDTFTYAISDGQTYTSTTTTITNENLITQSEAFNSSAWTLFSDSGGLPTVTANVASGPNGGAATADELALSGVNKGIFFDTNVSGQYTFSVWVKLVSGDGRLQLNYYDGDDGGSSVTVTATGTWQRVSYTFTGDGSATANVALMHGGGLSGTGVFEIWGAQLNPGAAPTAYLPTEGSVATTTTTTSTTITPEAELTVTIAGPTPASGSPPVAVNNSASVTVNGTTAASGNVLANDSDPQGLPLQVVQVDGQAADVGATIVGEYGSLVLGANGAYQYVLATGQANVQALEPGQTVSDVFTYAISDGNTYTSTTTTVTNENLITQSEAFNSSVWVPFSDSGAAPTVAANVAAGPDGGAATADQLTLSGANTGIFFDTNVSGQYTFSVWIKLVSGDGQLELNYYDGDDTGSSVTVTATGTWQRVSYTFDGDGSANANVALMHGGGQTDTGVFEIWGAQLNPGAAPSDYLSTDGSVATTTTTATTTVTPEASLTINVTGGAPAGGAPPEVIGDTASVMVGGTSTASGNVLANDSDPQGLPLQVVQVDGQAADVGATIVGEYGSLVLGANGSYQYVLATGQANAQALLPGETVTDTFTYAVSDGAATTTTTTAVSGQNFLLQSEAFDDPSWVKFGSSNTMPIVTANVAAGPNGGAATADQVALDGANSGLYYVTPVEGEYTYSVWVKLVTGDGNFDLNYYNGSTGQETAFVATSSWQRVSITFDANGASAQNVAFMHDGSQTGTGTFQLYGAQLNPGTTMGDYAPTTGHVNSVFTTTTSTAPPTADLTISVSAPPPAPTPSHAIDFSGSTEGVIVNLQTDQWTHPLNILPLGDSITYGWTSLDNQDGQTNTEDGYRGPLWWDFAENNMMINFVGPNTSGDAYLPSQSEGGFPGERSDQIADQLPGILATSHPDAIMLMAGDNDIFQETDPAEHVAASLNTMIQETAEVSPSTHLYIATLMPINQADDGEPGDAAMVPTVNAAIEATVSAAAQAGYNVSLVDTSSITLSDIADAAHPTAAGYSELANIWYDAIMASQPDAGGTPGGDVYSLSSGIQTVTGTPENDLLVANNLNDTLNGGAGNDRLVAGGGSDTMTGGSGSDQFVFAPGDGPTVITDFSQTDPDHIELDGFSGLSQFSQLSGHISVSGGSTIIDLSDFGSPTTITLAHFTGTLTASDIWFG